jgi:hypothetical protein
MADAAAYIRHAELFGPEQILETAAEDRHITKQDLGEIAGWLKSRHRSYYWQQGRAGGPDSQWRERRTKAKPCEHCGLDLPPGMRTDARYHRHCTQAAYRARQHASHNANAA